ncbi:MAG: hypothetical protein AAGE84_05770 [Cyanobacteria bacterium P01_G01_bin.39]
MYKVLEFENIESLSYSKEFKDFNLVDGLLFAVTKLETSNIGGFYYSADSKQIGHFKFRFAAKKFEYDFEPYLYKELLELLPIWFWLLQLESGVKPEINIEKILGFAIAVAQLRSNRMYCGEV